MTEFRCVISRLCLLAFFCLPGVCAAQSDETGLRGTWIGAITVDEVFGLTDEEIDFLRRAYIAPVFRLRKSRTGELRIYYERGARRWTAFRQQVVQFDAGDRAVVSVQNESEDGVETLAFNIAKVDQDTLRVYLWHVSNFSAGESESDRSILAIGGHGEFRKIGR